MIKFIEIFKNFPENLKYKRPIISLKTLSRYHIQTGFLQTNKDLGNYCNLLQ